MKVSLSYHFYKKMQSHLFSRPFSQESYQSKSRENVQTKELNVQSCNINAIKSDDVY